MPYPDTDPLAQKHENLRQAAYILARQEPLYPYLEKFMQTEVPAKILGRFWDAYRENPSESGFQSAVESLLLTWK